MTIETDTDSSERRERTSDAERDRMRKIELIRDRTGVSREAARAALELTDFDALDAVTLLERQGAAAPRTVHVSTADVAADGPEASDATDQMTRAQIEYERDTRRSRIEDLLVRLIDRIRWLLQRGIDISLAVERHGHRILSIPVLLVLISIAAIPPVIVTVMILGLLLGFRYHFEGPGGIVADLSELSRKASEAAERSRSRFREDMSDSG